MFQVLEELEESPTLRATTPSGAGSTPGVLRSCSRPLASAAGDPAASDSDGLQAKRTPNASSPSWTPSASVETVTVLWLSSGRTASVRSATAV